MYVGPALNYTPFGTLFFFIINKITNHILPFSARVCLLNDLSVEGIIVPDEILLSILLVAARFLIATYWKSETNQKT